MAAREPRPGLVAPGPARVAEGFLADTGLAAVFEELQVGYRDHDLLPLYRAPLVEPAAIAARQAVMQDLDRPRLEAAARDFLLGLRRVRETLEQGRRLYPRRPKAYYRLAAFLVYVEALAAFAEGLEAAAPASRGLKEAAAYLKAHLARPEVAGRRREAAEIRSALLGVRYLLHIEEARVSVYPPEALDDLVARLERIFAPLGRGRGPELRLPPRGPEMNHVEEGILEGVAKLYPEPFARLERFASELGAFQDPGVRAIERGLAFFLAYRDLLAPLKEAGLAFAYPELAPGAAGWARGAFPLDLARAREGGVVANDFAFDEGRILVVTGPNQGGKTTFARTVAQVHYLAGLGLPVPAAAARIAPVRRFFSHFPRREAAEDLTSRLEDDLLRMRPILEAAGEDALAILNEPFASATAPDALALGLRVLARLREGGARAVWVTFLPELARQPGVQSYVAQLDPDDPTRRTFRVVPAPPSERAYAEILARRYRLTYPELKARLARWKSG